MSEKPNDTARLQFLAILEYLLTKTDEDHLSRTSDIQKFAEEQYSVSLRREQVKSIVEHIYELSKTHKKVLPYEIKCSNKTGVNKKYYVAKKKFDVDTIVKVCSAIGNEKTITKQDSSYLIKQLVDDYVVSDKQKVASKKIEQRIRNTKKMDVALSKKTDTIYDLNFTRDVFEFSLNAITSDVFEQSCRSYGPDNTTIAAKTKYRGVVIKIEEDKKTKHLFVFIYLQELKAIIKTSIENVIDIDDYGIPYHNGNVNLLEEEAQLYRHFHSRSNIRVNQYSTVQKVMEKKWGKHTFALKNVTFKFCINTPEKPNEALFNKTKESFEKYFECPMQYEKKEREYVLYEGTEDEERGTALDVYVTVETDFFAFKKWVTEEALILDNIVVMTPELNRWNDYLVGSLIERYVRRLNKYGYYYHYELSKELTEPAKKEREEYEQEMNEWEAERKANKERASTNHDTSENK